MFAVNTFPVDSIPLLVLPSEGGKIDEHAVDRCVTQKRPELSTADSDDKLHTGSQQVAAGREKDS